MRLSELFFGAWCMTLMNGIATVVTEVCRRGEHPVYTTELKCCPKCEKSLPQEPCSHETIECRCHEGFGCQTTSCTECIQLPMCKSGERLRRTEMSSSFYQYKCEKCPSGMDLDMKSGQCKPVEVPRTSPTTKNPSTGSTTGSNIPDNNNNTWIFMCVFVGVFLLLITVVIHLLIHKIKMAKSLKMEGDLIQQHTIVPINIKEDGDTWSYQYPEEEHGDGALKTAAF
ncbi:uncharacterized protein LOC120915460 [Rana temporaria]|uniref:uncharacterized protein LOC120915460 n=1 Tax=Rana temporaria TaxID=8407 RepID=UPI001AADF603|nr:uncharacterized protein LOC120915460 [Rana temporaria]